MPRPPSSPSPSPPPFAFTTGSFDFPQASTSPPNHVARRIFNAARESDVADNLSRRPPTANPNRPRATPSERYLRRSQARIREQLDTEVDFAETRADPMSDLPMNNPFTISHAQSRPRSPIVQVNSERRRKRRKLQHDPTRAPEYMCYKYGHKGQVVPGRLRMEIVSCDGGEHRRDHPAGLYRVQNLLRNDKSVYCSESSQCNLLLKHIGEGAFALDKIVIRAPDNGFSAPVQEGLVFVSMSADHLLSRTSAYNLRYGSRSPLMSPTPSSPNGDNEQLSLREALEDPSLWQYSRRDIETRERYESLRRRGERLGVLQQMMAHQDEADGDNCDHAAEEPYSSAAGVSAPTPPPFTVTTVASEEEESDSNQELSSAAVMADRLRRESRWRPDSDDEDEETMPRLGPLRRAPALDYSTYGEWRERRERHLDPIRATRVTTPSRIEPSEPSADADSLLPPHARFFIAKNKNKITIKFHPAISGKHVLLKFWSPKHDGNIDIESVQFYGYSGPRFFPAVQPR
ncbi:hypothetical protein BDW02DRAFT_564346 [Decorospora gaudefroyi]|uniref:Uncharacterized protein n=1 Tax=Decorospora gaudefroyi TaxID=184978 RepID=A0A6A5KS70_9PLEO|nr:hypothetical protein BDW02DRAFT_564346 [Decorospora gaudefroyi]